MERFKALIANDELLSKLFNNCPEEIRKRQVIKIVPANYVLIKKDEEVNSVFILVSGRLDVFKMDDKDNGLAYLSNDPPCFAGILEVLSGGKVANATVRTSQESVIIIVNGQDFKQWIESDFESYKLVFTNFVKDMYHTLNDIDPKALLHGKNLLMKYLSFNFRDEIMMNGRIDIELNKEVFSSRLDMNIGSLEDNLSTLLKEQLISIESEFLCITEQQLGRIESFLLHNSSSR
jgi:hypothetical protein